MGISVVKGVKALWVLERGAFKQTSYDLFLTEDKVVLAKLCTHRIAPASTFEMKSTAATLAKGGVIGGPLATASRTETMEKAVEMTKKSMDEILANKENFAINKSDIEEVKLERKGVLKNLIWLEIKAKNKKYKWQIMGIPGQEEGKYEDVEEMIKSAFPSVRTKEKLLGI